MPPANAMFFQKIDEPPLIGEIAVEGEGGHDRQRDQDGRHDPRAIAHHQRERAADLDQRGDGAADLRQGQAGGPDI